MDALLSQLKGQGSPFSSPPPKPNSVEKLLDTIHLLSQATVLVAHQLQEQNTPVKAKPRRETHLPTPPLTPKSSPVPPAKKTPPPKTSAPVLSWVPRAPEYYRLPSPNPTTSTSTSVLTPAKPTSLTPHTKKDRKPKSKRITPSTQPTPSPTPTTTTPATPRPVQTDQLGPLAPTNPTPSPTPITGQAQPDQRAPLPLSTPRPAQSDQRELPTPTPSTSTNAKAAAKAETKARRKLTLQEKRKSALAASATPPTAASAAPTPTPPPTFEDDVVPMAPANHIVNFPHSYDNCPRLPDCPAHRVEFAVYSQAYADKTRGAPLPSFPQPYAESGFGLRAERDTAWWPVPPSNSSSPPGSPVDPDAFLFPPPDDDSHLI